jgi:formylmethanofuran dehydrogenase subunit B
MTVYDDVVCPFCGCCCDDLRIEVEENRIAKIENACVLGRAKFEAYRVDRHTTPVGLKDGVPRQMKLEEAVDWVAETLVRSRYPLLYGWSSTSCEAIKLGIELAEEVGGVCDNTTTVCHGPTILGVHDVGEVAATLGTVRHRADLVVYWGCNPVHAHPKHMARYTIFPRGRFVGGRSERRLVVVDPRRTETARLADVFVQIQSGSDYEVISALRMAVRNEEIEADVVGGVPVERIEELADLMTGCRFGILFFGLGLTMSDGKNRNIDAAISLVRDLNARTKFLIMPMRGHFNVSGANIVSTWQTGYPFAVDFSRGYPYYNPGETSAVDLLARGECDSALVVASDPVANFPRAAARNLVGVPLAVIDSHISATSTCACVTIPSALVGIEASGTTYRMDGVPLPLRKVVDPPEGVRTDEEILGAILRRVRELKGGG